MPSSAGHRLPGELDTAFSPRDKVKSGRPGHTRGMDDTVRAYVDAIAPEHRPLFDRMHRLVRNAYPDAVVVLSYQMPTYKVGRRRLHVGAWQHGISLYGCKSDRDSGFAARHPELQTSKGTI